jgi:methionyl-tRNA formyltransferase
MVTTAPALRIVFFGTPEFAVPTLHALDQSRHSLVGVVTQPDRARGRGQKAQPGAVKQYAESARLPMFQPEKLRDPVFLETLRDVRADLGVVAAYGKILPNAVLTIPALGLINVHASLLPKYRGAAPVHRAVIAGDKETGVTIMRVVEALDAGPMLSRVVRSIGEDETSLDVERGLADLGAGMLLQAVDALAEGRAVEIPQNDSDATYARKIERADGVIEWSRPATEIHNQIRGLHPWPHAFAELSGERVILLRSAVDDASLMTPNSPPGSILLARGDDLRVQTGAGVLAVLGLQREGRRPMSTREFLAGRPIAPGERFARAPAGP